MSNWFCSIHGSSSTAQSLVFTAFMLFSLLSPCHGTLQPFLTVDDFERSKNDEQTTFLSDEDFRNAEKYNDLLLDKKSSRAYILSHQKYYHGDIRGRAQWNSKPNRYQKEGVRRNGVISTIKKWHQGRIPYTLSSQYNERERAVLARAIQEYHRQTCIRFTPKEHYDRDYLYIGKIDGCFSDVGRASGRQELSLDDGCLQYDTIIHELMHAIEAYDQFGKVDLTESSYYGQGYDYHSIMHYDSLAFSKNGKETLVAKQPRMTQVIGSALDFSPIDLIKIRFMYYCSSRAEPSVPATNHIAPQSLNYGTLRVETPWATSPGLQTIIPVNNHIVDQASSLPILPLPRAHEEIKTDIPCADRSTLCYRWLDRCHSPFFEKVMREFCARSCGFCSPPPTQIWRTEPMRRPSKQDYQQLLFYQTTSLLKPRLISSA